jgi:hypothetical protein
MAGPGQARFYSSTFVQTSLAAGIGPATTSFNVGTTTGAPGTPFEISVDQNTASEELMLVTNVSGLTYTVTRAQGGTAAMSHSNGAPVVHVMYAQDLTDASAHIGAFDNVHGLSVGSLVVGTTDTQTLTNKTLTSPVINTPTITTPTISGTSTTGPITSSGLVKGTDFQATGLTGATAASRYVGATSGGAPVSGSFLMGDFVVDTVNNTFLVCNTAGSPGSWNTIVNRSNSETLTNKTLTSPVINGSVTGNASVSLSNFIVANEFIANGITGAAAASTYAGGTASGAPTTGAHTLGEFVIDQTGKIWICTSAGTPGTWAPVGGIGLPTAPISTAANGTATSGTTDTIDTVLGNYQFTAIAGRRYRVTLANLVCNSDTANVAYSLRVRDSGSAATPTTASTAVIDTAWQDNVGTGSSGRDMLTLTDTFIAGAGGTHTLAFFAQRPGASGIFTPISPASVAGTGSRKLWVEDLGTV